MGEIDIGKDSWEFEIKARERCVSIDCLDVGLVIIITGRYRSMYVATASRGEGINNATRYRTRFTVVNPLINIGRFKAWH